jgi:hypothetical protein
MRKYHAVVGEIIILDRHHANSVERKSALAMPSNLTHAAACGNFGNGQIERPLGAYNVLTTVSA